MREGGLNWWEGRQACRCQGQGGIRQAGRQAGGQAEGREESGRRAGRQAEGTEESGRQTGGQGRAERRQKGRNQGYTVCMQLEAGRRKDALCATEPAGPGPAQPGRHLLASLLGVKADEGIVQAVTRLPVPVGRQADSTAVDQDRAILASEQAGRQAQSNRKPAGAGRRATQAACNPTRAPHARHPAT